MKRRIRSWWNRRQCQKHGHAYSDWNENQQWIFGAFRTCTRTDCGIMEWKPEEELQKMIKAFQEAFRNIQSDITKGMISFSKALRKTQS